MNYHFRFPNVIGRRPAITWNHSIKASRARAASASVLLPTQWAIDIMWHAGLADEQSIAISNAEEEARRNNPSSRDIISPALRASIIDASFLNASEHTMPHAANTISCGIWRMALMKSLLLLSYLPHHDQHENHRQVLLSSLLVAQCAVYILVVSQITRIWAHYYIYRHFSSMPALIYTGMYIAFARPADASVIPTILKYLLTFLSSSLAAKWANHCDEIIVPDATT